MKYFIIEGTLKSSNPIDEDIMKGHIAYSKIAMQNGRILTSGIKDDLSGGLFIMKAESIKEIEEYLETEPFKIYGIQDYKIIEFMPHYFNQSPNQWF